MPRSAFAGALTAIIFWGLSFVATKAALAEMSVVALLFTRFALGCVVLHAILVARGERLMPPRASWGSLALLGFVGVFVHQLLQANGLTRTTAVKTGWLIGIIPIWSAILAAIFLGERLDRRKVLGLVVGFAGAVLVVTRGDLSGNVLALPATQGDFLVVASTVNWAVYTVIARGTVGLLGSARATAGSMLFGWLMLAPLFLFDGGWREWAGISTRAWVAIAFLGICCSGLAYLFWYAALARAEASKVSAFLYLEPLVTCAAAVPLLGEPLGVSTVVGGLVVLCGVALLQGTPRRAPRSLPATGSPGDGDL